MPQLKNPIITAVTVKLREAGWRHKDIAALFGCHPDTVRSWARPDFEERKLKAREWRKQNAAIIPRVFSDRRRDAADLMMKIPPDTRNLTARTFGDPLPGRSALARRYSVDSLCIASVISTGSGAQGVK